MDGEILLLVITLLVIALFFMFITFLPQIWQIFFNKFGVRVKNLYYFQDNYLLLLIYFLGILANIIYTYLGGKYVNIKKITFKRKKTIL